MNILLDTHIAVWAITDDPRLSPKARELLLDPGNNIYFSVISAMEIALKRKSRSNNLDFTTEEFVDYCEKAGYIQLLLKSEHILAEENLRRKGEGPEHQDPFDRFLIAQAKVEKLSFMTHDHEIPSFDVKGIISI
ncbi:MAG: type II toxin-antitoxin system VapC family toxin [Lachnospiraceae bacterium]|nr:type II toxin-antitoxin system VapC family toxin [Lachnospiraceae bacterium]